MVLKIGGINFDANKALFARCPELKGNKAVIKYNGNEYILIDDKTDCDCICDQRAIDFYNRKNIWNLQEIEKGVYDYLNISEKLLRFNLESFCSDTLINYRKYLCKAKTLPLDLNLF